MLWCGSAACLTHMVPRRRGKDKRAESGASASTATIAAPKQSTVPPAAGITPQGTLDMLNEARGGGSGSSSGVEERAVSLCTGGADRGG